MSAVSANAAAVSNNRRRGSILISLLLGLGTLAIGLSVMIPLFQLIADQDFLCRKDQDQLALRQLQQLLLKAEAVKPQGSSLEFVMEGESRRLIRSGKWLLIQPGTWIFFDQVRNVAFNKEGTSIVMELSTDHGELREVIGLDE